MKLSATNLPNSTSESQPSITLPTAPHALPLPPCSKMMIQVAHCPSELKRSCWLAADFEVRRLVYNGRTSLVYHAVDRRSGISIALKLYRRSKLSDIERVQVSVTQPNT